MKNCGLCGETVATNKTHTLRAPDQKETLICAECVQDFYYYVNSGKADQDRMERAEKKSVPF